MSVPTLTTREMPADRAAASTPSTGSPMMSMCVWASNAPGEGRRSSGTTGPFGLLITGEPGDFLVDYRLVQLAEQRGGNGQRRASRDRARSPPEGRVVGAGDH